MANGTQQPNSGPPSTRTVDALSSVVDYLSQEVHGIRSSIAALHSKMDANQEAIRAQINDRQKSTWPAIGAGIGFLAFISIFLIFGFSSYINVIRETQARTEASIQLLAENVVPREEINDRRELSAERTDRIEADVLRLQGSVFPREVHQERWLSISNEINHIREEQARIAEAFRIDQGRQDGDFKSLYPASNALDAMVARIERLESRWIGADRPTSTIP